MISNQENKIVYAGTAGPDLDFTFPIFEAGDLVVTRFTIVTGAEATFTLNTDYTVTIDGELGGTVTLLAGPPGSAYKTIIKRIMDLTQETDYVEGDPFPAESHEDALDKLTMITQQLDEEIDRCLKLDTSQTGVSTILPVPTALKYLRWNVTATALENASVTALEYPGTITVGLDANKSVNPAQGDIYIATDTSKLYICYISSAWTEISGGGATSLAAITRSISQATHGFVVGDVLRLSSGTYIKAQANSAAGAQAVGIVSEVPNNNNFSLTLSGYVTGLSGLTAGTVYYLSDSVAGALTATEPVTVGYISKQLFIATSTTAGYFFNMRGLVIEAAAADPYKVKASASDPIADYLDGKVAKSIVVTSNKLELSGDNISPGNSKYYGTNVSGTKGFYALPSMGYLSAQLFTSNGTFNVPTGISLVYVTMTGGGAGGGRVDQQSGGGGGGGAQSIIKRPIAVTASGTCAVVVGAGGAGATTEGSAGIAGGNSTFAGSSETLTALGGLKGSSGGVGGAARPVRTAVATIGGLIGEEGGAAANGGSEVGGGGGGTNFGTGGSSNGNAGIGYGSGGAGGYAHNGGAGASGFVLVEW
jgi:hypothetical protein